ncbi:MAG: tyrosine-type recombinase/integrase [Anaerolineae bacterium]|nr:tyrosine-type recombinase/integrase [Anaerolineae bacterium]
MGHTKRSDPNSPISVRAVQRMIERLRQSAGVQHVTPHYFRHVFATRALDKTDNLAVVQDLLGHASPVTTRLYAQTSSEQLQSAHREMWE